MIYKRGKQWHMDATIRGERYRESLGTSDRREALNLEKKRIAEIQQGKAATAADREFARLVFGEAADAFLRERPGHVSERSVQFEKERLKPLKEFFEHKQVGKIRADDIRAYQRTRLEAGLSSKTINMDIGVLRLLLKRAKTWTLVADDVRLFPKQPRIIPKVLTKEQKSHLFRVASSRPDWMVAYCAAVLAVSTTCRSVELKNLRWVDIDIFNQSMRVRRSKTDAGHRTIPLNRDATLALAKLRERAAAFGSGAPEHRIFPACENKHVDPNAPQKELAVSLATIDQGCGFSAFSIPRFATSSNHGNGGSRCFGRDYHGAGRSHRSGHDGALQPRSDGRKARCT
jgi:integrase